MLDGKILAAVLATLAAFGVASSGQTNGESPMKSFNVPSMDDLSPRNIGAFTGLIPKDTTTSQVRATLSYNKSDAQTVDIDSQSLDIANLSVLNTNSQTITSDEGIIFKDFKGTLHSSIESNVKGSSSSIFTSGVNISGGFNFDTVTKTERIHAADVKEADFSLEDVQGSIKSGSTSAELSDGTTDVNIRSFKGNITFHPQSGEIELQGEVSSLKAGDVSIG